MKKGNYSYDGNRMAIGLCMGFIGGLLLDNLALGCALGIIFGGFPVKNKENEE